MQSIKEKCMKDVKDKMLEVAKTENDKDLVESIIGDVGNCMNQEDQENATTQQLVGIDLIFKGWVMKN